MVDEKIMQQLREIAKQGNYDVIEEVAELNGKPVFRLRKSSIPKGAKIGWPFLLSVNKSQKVFELNINETHQVIRLDSWLNKRLK